VAGEPRPKGMFKPRVVKRDWTDMRAKVEREGMCRRCGCTSGLEAAHIVARSRMRPGPAEDPLNCVPLCRHCHELYDLLGLNISPFLKPEEWAYVVGLVGWAEARRRITNRRDAA
jgi:5-methylcytosine-specific restriction endonuclease McrA